MQGVSKKALTNWGVFKNTIDGNFGPLTESAVKLFQTKKGLNADGIVGLFAYRHTKRKRLENWRI